MNRDEFRLLQAPLKQKYTDVPEEALITFKTSSRLSENLTCDVETGKGLVKAGLHPSTGGDGLALCSGQMLLESLAACAGVTLNTVATAIGIELNDAVVSVEGDLDVRGTLAVSREAPVGFKDIRVKFSLNCGEGPDKKMIDSLIELTERYCIVFQTIASATNVEVSCAIK